MRESVQQITIEQFSKPDGRVLWNWCFFGEEKLLADGEAETLDAALVGARRVLAEWEQ